ncbi:hypothetical protein [Streptomyces sp. NRRL S-1521]|uniref:hypothetical protein n=1 Tax=Streptomyces sp. NRRL S-1521 TaxID=1609100 RepID=UPI00074A405B|nr:hypothetical protein [Streptomyces sp. NRRL S-1521]KUL53150.1 hypothetical protein ADL30_20590 [Streptomyces sp. NRRL S-1521]
MTRRKNYFDKIVRDLDRLNRDTSKAIQRGLGTKKRKKKGGGKGARISERRLDALTVQLSQLALQVSELRTLVAAKEAKAAGNA